MEDYKKVVIFIIAFFLIIAGISLNLNKVLSKNNTEETKDDFNTNNNEIKTMGYDDELYVYASFYWYPLYPDPGENVIFYSSSYASNGDITSERWHFQDGQIAYGYMVTHTFEKEGSYRVTLDVDARGYDGDYDSDLSIRYVEVGADPFPKITYEPVDPSPGEKVTLDASGSIDLDGEIISYKWSVHPADDPVNTCDIGLGSKAYYTFQEQGIFTISLFIEDDKGNNNTIEENIVVSILKLGGFPDNSKVLSFEISNHGNFTANDVVWSIEINKYYPLGIRFRSIYQNDGTISKLNSDSSKEIEIEDIRRKFCKVELVVAAKADNAFEVNKSFYGLIFGKRIFLSENNFINPYAILKVSGLTLSTILFVMLMSRLYR